MLKRAYDYAGGDNIPTLVNLPINELYQIHVGAHELLNICNPVIRRVAAEEDRQILVAHNIYLRLCLYHNILLLLSVCPLVSGASLLSDDLTNQKWRKTSSHVLQIGGTSGLDTNRPALTLVTGSRYLRYVLRQS